MTAAEKAQRLQAAKDRLLAINPQQVSILTVRSTHKHTYFRVLVAFDGAVEDITWAVGHLAGKPLQPEGGTLRAENDGFPAHWDVRLPLREVLNNHDLAFVAL